MVKLLNRLSDITLKKIKLGDGKIQHRKIKVGPYGSIDIVDGDLEDMDAFIQSNEENAGAFNYIRKEMANGRSFNDIIAQGNIALQNQLFADVSNIPENITASEAEERIASGVDSLVRVAQVLGVSPDELAGFTSEQIQAAINKVVEIQTKAKVEKTEEK